MKFDCVCSLTSQRLLCQEWDMWRKGWMIYLFQNQAASSRTNIEVGEGGGWKDCEWVSELASVHKSRCRAYISTVPKIQCILLYRLRSDAIWCKRRHLESTPVWHQLRSWSKSFFSSVFVGAAIIFEALWWTQNWCRLQLPTYTKD